MGSLSEAFSLLTVNLMFLMSYWCVNRSTSEGVEALQMALHTLRMMALGGINDHVLQVPALSAKKKKNSLNSFILQLRDGHPVNICKLSEGINRFHLSTALVLMSLQGFHRYSTDSSWHVPHFEKMLYDQAQLAVAYITASQVRAGIHGPASCCPSICKRFIISVTLVSQRHRYQRIEVKQLTNAHHSEVICEETEEVSLHFLHAVVFKGWCLMRMSSNSNLSICISLQINNTKARVRLRNES